MEREGKDDRDHLYVFVCSKDPPWPVEGIDELLNDHGRRATIIWPELLEHDGLQLYGSGDGLTLLSFLLWHYPGEIEVRWPPRRRRQRPHEAAWSEPSDPACGNTMSEPMRQTQGAPQLILRCSKGRRN